MKNYFKKMSLLLAVSSTIALTSSIGAFAADNSTTEGSSINAIIESTAKVGDQLPEPEAGWTRFQSNDTNLIYIGEWEFYDTDAVGFAQNDSLKFNFNGNKIRIIGVTIPDILSNVEISIDGKIQTFTECSTNDEIQQNVIVFENLDLENGEHTVVITNKLIDCLIIRGIDINEGGQLKPYDNQVATTTPTAVQATV